MACMVSFAFSMHFRAPQTLAKEINPRRSALGRLSRPATTKTAIALHARECSNRDTSLARRSCNHHISKHGGHVCRSVSRYSNVSFSTPIVLLGFWVGPDIEDGWGFAEAFVNRII
ncbi:UDP-N-acetylmuramoylalanine--D-glutamate ligase [Actinidia chinensis var. chinensis]|uniref:UDP-N-acetylmuramoylalanine--D-glutamate ligase n=1 Tax=Actinidia chinensis var. chinensis TaxID=1590841 RepID=A0A2R6QL52_ACTCC|nr:UDP-N-acetylmuramoylalanine--D-glutamate ligase [Actinidia chinensis var. chinensis]